MAVPAAQEAPGSFQEAAERAAAAMQQRLSEELGKLVFELAVEHEVRRAMLLERCHVGLVAQDVDAPTERSPPPESCAVSPEPEASSPEPEAPPPEAPPEPPRPPTLARVGKQRTKGRLQLPDAPGADEVIMLSPHTLGEDSSLRDGAGSHSASDPSPLAAGVQQAAELRARVALKSVTATSSRMASQMTSVSEAAARMPRVSGLSDCSGLTGILPGGRFTGVPDLAGNSIDGWQVLPFWQQEEGVVRATYNSKASIAKSPSLVSVSEDRSVDDYPPWVIFLNRFVVHPSSPKRLLWDLCGLMLIGYDAVMIPLDMFPIETIAAMHIMTWISRLFWTLDMPGSLVTGFLLQDGDSEMRLPKIARRYLRSWFLIDLLVVLCDWLDVFITGVESISAARMTKTMRIMRMLRVLRLVRLAKLPWLAGTMWETYMRSKKVSLTAGIFKLMCIIICIMHFIACCWYGLAAQNVDDENWTLEVFDGRDDVLYFYTTSFHWSLTQFTGTMEVTPVNNTERIFAVCVLLLSFVISAIFVSNITSSMTQLNMLAGNEAAMFASLRDYLVDKGISRQLMVRVHRNAHYALLESRSNSPETDIELLSYISEPLRMEIHFELYIPSLREHPFFRRYEEEHIAALKKICHSAVSHTFLSPGDLLFIDGETKEPPEMYFLTKGVVAYRTASCGTLKLMPGAWFAEPVLWCYWSHQGTLRARTECCLLVLNAEIFQKVAAQNRSPSINLPRYAIEYVKVLNETDHPTDVDEDDELCNEAVHRAFVPSDADCTPLDSGGGWYPMGHHRRTSKVSAPDRSGLRGFMQRASVLGSPFFLNKQPSRTSLSVGRASKIVREMPTDTMHGKPRMSFFR